ncbi:MAG: methyltransferase domain-containing protein, partial [Anaerolineae bacterium]|nr:methyltransferase domain-containing protein [Anaerolineae bacterium]
RSDYYLEICGGFEEFVGGTVAPRLLQAFDCGEVEPGMRILDLGCGRGELTLKCAEAGCWVWASVYSADALKIASNHIRTSASAEIAARILFQRMDAKSLAFSSGFFDRVFMIDVVEHLFPEELESALQAVGRVTRPGGRLVVHTALNAWLVQPIYLIAGLLFRWSRHPYHVNEQSYFSLLRVLSGLGGSTKVQIIKVPGFFALGVGPQAHPDSRLHRFARALDR